MSRESDVDASVRWELLALLQEEFKEFVPFLREVMTHLGFTLSEIQEDIANFMQYGPAFLMIQAQRGQAKTTIAAAFAVWCLIQHPEWRVLILSAGGTQANEISTLIVRIIMTMDILECIRPDKHAGDRTSVASFDLHHSLKGVDKSPSVACAGIGANLQGKRADLLIPDDIESSKNSATALQRAQLLHLTLDFTSIANAEHARVVWLGTPQTSESIYNTLPGRGVTVRVWPGRYPTPEQVENYGEHLAPLIAQRLAANPALGGGHGPMLDEGAPTDPSFKGEQILLRTRMDQGPAYFQLQHMLNTRLSDAARFPLKPERLLVMRLDHSHRVPLTVSPSFTRANLQHCASGTFAFKVSRPETVSQETVTCPLIHMYVDPAPGGLNGDETGYAITGMANSNIFAFDIGGVVGGYEEQKLMALALICKKWDVDVVSIEKNMGYGAFREVWTPILRSVCPGVAIQDDMVHGQKEKRILATIEPILGRGALIINEDIITTDWESASARGTRGQTYSLFFQMAKLTRDRNSLIHDDRLDALEGGCRFWQAQLAIDQKDALAAAQRKAFTELTKDPLGYNRYKKPGARWNMLNRRLGR